MSGGGGRGVNVVPQSVASNGLRDKSRMQLVTSSQSRSHSSPSLSVSSSSSGVGRQRENNERRTEQRGLGGGKGKKQQQQQQGGSRRGDHEENNGPRRERIHLPVAGRSRPISEQNDKSRNRRDFANPTADSRSSSLHNNERVALNDGDDDNEAGASTGGDDNEFYERAFNSDNSAGNQFSGGEVGEMDEEDEEEGETTGYEDSERRILELLRQAPKEVQSSSGNRNEAEDREKGKGEERKNESIRLAGKGKETLLVDDKWESENLTSSLSPAGRSTSSADIDPVIKYAEEHRPLNRDKEEDVAKLKRTLNLGNVSDSDVLFHHFKDFPVGLLALRPVRMNVDRQFIRATVQMFVTTWRHIEEGANAFRERYPLRGKPQYGSERRKKRRRRDSDGNSGGSESVRGDKITILSTNSDRMVNRDEVDADRVVNSSVSQGNQSFNASGLDQRVNYQNHSEASKSSSLRIVKSGDVVDSATGTSIGPDAVPDISSKSNDDLFVNDGPIEDIPAAVHSPNVRETGSALPGNAITGEHKRSDANGLSVENIVKTGGGDGDSVSDYYTDTRMDNSENEPPGIAIGYSEENDNARGGDMVQSNMLVKTKRKHGASEQQEMNPIRRSGAGYPVDGGVGSGGGSQRQQILGAWANNNKNVHNKWGAVRPRVLGGPQYAGGCYGTPNRTDARRAESFAR